MAGERHVIVWALLCALFCWLSHAQNPPPPYFFELGTFDPQGPNATCMTGAEVATQWPTEWAACVPVLSQLYANSTGGLNGTSFYVDANQARRNLLGGLLVIYAAPSSRECQSASLALSCLAQFRRCHTETVETSPGTFEDMIVATPVCRSHCDRWSIDCLFTGDITPAYILFNCTTPTPYLWDNYTVPLFPQRINSVVPVHSVVNPNQTFDMAIPCTTTDLSPVSSAQLCPSPLLPDYTTGYCSLGCPLPVITSDEYLGLEIMMSVFGWISFVLTAFLIATYIIDPTKRVYPAILPLFFIFCINATSFAFCLGSMVGHEDVWCEDDATPYDFGGGACTVQGIIWVYFTMAGVFWWTIIAINLMLMLVSTKFKEFMARWYHLYHIIWLLPIITLIISLANEKLGYGGDVWCSVHIGPSTVSYYQTQNGVQTEEDDTAYLWNLLLIIVPIFCLVFVGMVCLSIVLIYMGINYKNLGWTYLATQWRLFVFLMFYIYIYVFVFAFQIELIVQKDDQYAAYADYINCLLLHLFNLSLDCQLSQYVNYPLWVIVVFNASAQGIFVFVIFGTTLQVYKAWLHLLWIDRLFGWSTATSTGGSTSTTKIQGKVVSSKSGSAMSQGDMLEEQEEEGSDDKEESSSEDSGSEKSKNSETEKDKESSEDSSD